MKGTGFPYLFLIFHPQNEVSRNNDDWRDQLLHQTLTAEKAPYISSKIVTRKHALVDNKASYSEYYLQNDGHPTTLQNLLIAEEIKNYVINIGREEGSSKGDSLMGIYRTPSQMKENG